MLRLLHCVISSLVVVGLLLRPRLILVLGPGVGSSSLLVVALVTDEYIMIAVLRILTIYTMYIAFLSLYAVHFVTITTSSPLLFFSHRYAIRKKRTRLRLVRPQHTRHPTTYSYDYDLIHTTHTVSHIYVLIFQFFSTTKI